MSQEVSTNQKASDSSYTEQISTQPWSAETYAEKLMDDLFSDIDRVLENGSKLPTEPVQPEYVSLQAIKIPQITMPSAVIPFQKREAEPEAKTTANETIKKQEVQITARPPANNYLVEKLLLAGACLCGLGTLILWLVANKHINWSFSQQTVTSVPIAQKQQVIEADPQFINYMMRSLEVIDRKAQASKKQQASSNLPTLSSQPTVSVPSNVNQPIRQYNLAPNVLERVYIPYQAPQTSPPVRTAPTPTKKSSTSPRPAASAPTLATIPKASVKYQPPISNMPPLVLTPPPPPPSSLPETTPSATAAVAKYTLVGLLELGDRSAALFEINGVTQRIHAGESIGTSGWTLVTVANQEALMRRNGEIRSIYVGQKF